MNERHKRRKTGDISDPRRYLCGLPNHGGLFHNRIFSAGWKRAASEALPCSQVLQTQPHPACDRTSPPSITDSWLCCHILPGTSFWSTGGFPSMRTPYLTPQFPGPHGQRSSQDSRRQSARCPFPGHSGKLQERAQVSIHTFFS